MLSRVVRFSAYQPTLLPLSGLLILAGCLDRPLPSKTLKEPDAKPSHIEIDPSPQTSPASSRALKLAELAYSEVEIDRDQALADLLKEMPREGQTSASISMQDLRFLQEKYLEWARKNPQTLQRQPKPRSHQILRARGCKPLEDRYSDYASGLRLYKTRYKRNQSPCYFDNSKALESTLNLLLDEQKVTLQTRSGERELTSFDDLLTWIDEEHFDVSVSYRIYFAPFVRLYSVHDTREEEVPTPFWLDAGFTTPQGRSALVPATHSEVLLRFYREDLGSAEVKIYYSDKGFVYDDDELELPAWSGLRVLHVFERNELKTIFSNAKSLHEAFNVFKAQFPAPLPMSGFGLLGVCNDGAALLMRSLVGNNFLLPFPLVRSDLVSMPRVFPLRSTWMSLVSDVTPESLSSERRLERVGPRLLRSDPFVGGQESPFPAYNELISELRALVSEAPPQ